VRDPAQRDHSLTHVSDEPHLPALVVRISPKTFNGLFSITNMVSQKRSVSYKRMRRQRAVHATPRWSTRLSQ
jgi:hypothetical protein